jgi:hypothetical protein
MSTDVRLDQGSRGDTVLLEGGVVQATAFDFILDSPSRHIGRPGLRRALVHDFQDGLTINFNGDYPGGVTIAGNAVVTGDLVLPALNTSLAQLQSTLESIQFNGSQQQIAFALSRIDQLETTVASLVEFFGASVIPLWKTKTAVEEGDDEPALGGGTAIPSAKELGLIVEFKFEGQDPVGQGEDVLSITPAPGTAVKRGSTVVVTVKG